jgi:hypothetical protein
MVMFGGNFQRGTFEVEFKMAGYLSLTMNLCPIMRFSPVKTDLVVAVVEMTVSPWQHFLAQKG